VDAALMRTVDAALAIPRLFVLLLVLAVLDRIPLPLLVILLGATGWFGTSRLSGRKCCGSGAKGSSRRHARWARETGALSSATWCPMPRVR